MHVIKQEQAVVTLGVNARTYSVVAESNGRIANQKIKARRDYTERGHRYSITACLRFDDECRNGHETFTITADIREDGREYMSGCCHEYIAKHFPEFAPLIKWHLTSTDGPMHYVANTLYHAGDRDCWGLKAGETRQIRNGKTGELCWILEPVGETPKQYVDGPIAPAAPGFHYAPLNRVGEGKERQLDYARSSAVWPEATDAVLTQDPALLKTALLARLPALLAEFKGAMLGVGFVWPNR